MRLPLWQILAAVLFWSVYAPRAATPRERFDNANKFYEEHKYKEAIQEYSSLLAERRVSPNLLFNLANAYFRAGDIGRAVLNYRRAELLAPRDPEVQANLSFARDTVGGVPIHGPGRRALTYFGLNEISIALMTALWALCGIILLQLLKPTLRPTVRPGTLWIAVVFGFLLVWQILAYEVQSRPDAIVISKEAAVRYGPLNESQAQFSAREGSEFRVLDRRDGWIQVEDSSKRMGWVSTNAVAVVGDGRF